jgi:hypothetical protein
MASSIPRAKAAQRQATRPEHRPQPDDLFEPLSVYSTEEIATKLHISATAIRNWVREGRFDPSGVIDLPRGRRVYGWTINQYLRNRRMG